MGYTLYIAAYVIALVGVLGSMYTGAKRSRYQKETYQRYVYATLEIIANIITTIGFVLFAVSGVLMGYAWMIVFTVPTGCFTALHAYWIFHNEDNWFNDRWNKLKQAIKKAYKAATSVRINVPRPVTA